MMQKKNFFEQPHVALICDLLWTTHTMKNLENHKIARVSIKLTLRSQHPLCRKMWLRLCNPMFFKSYTTTWRISMYCFEQPVHKNTVMLNVPCRFPLEHSFDPRSIGVQTNPLPILFKSGTAGHQTNQYL